MSKVFDIENRMKIYRLIVNNPGLNLSKIAEMLNMNVPLVDYHTRNMKSDGLIDVIKESGYKRYYVKGKTGVQDKRFLGVLRQEIPLKIVLFLLENPHSLHKEILSQFSVAPSTLTYHLNKLVKNGIIHIKESGGERGYSIINEKEIIRFLTQYKPSKVLKRFKETWAGFHIP